MANISSISNINNQARDNVLTYQLNNELGASLAVQTTDTGFSIQLMAKSGQPIGEAQQVTVPLPPIPEPITVRSIYLDDSQRKIIVELSDGTSTSCSLDALYVDYASKQNKLLPGDGIEITNNTISLAEGVKASLCYDIVDEQPPIDPIQRDIPLAAALTQDGEQVYGEVDDQLTDLLF